MYIQFCKRIFIITLSFLFFSFITSCCDKDDEKHDKHLLAYYPFNGNANDESGNEHHAYVHSATLTNDKKGHSDKAYFFDGINDYIIIPSISTDYLEEGTISLWIKLSTDTIQFNIFSKDSLSISTEPMFRAQFGSSYGKHGKLNTFYFKVHGELYDSSYVPINDNYEFTGWHMYTFTWNSMVKKMYLDNNLIKEYNGSFISPASGELWLGAIPNYEQLLPENQEFLKGIIDEVRIYDLALTLKEIEALK